MQSLFKVSVLLLLAAVIAAPLAAPGSCFGMLSRPATGRMPSTYHASPRAWTDES